VDGGFRVAEVLVPSSGSSGGSPCLLVAFDLDSGLDAGTGSRIGSLSQGHADRGFARLRGDAGDSEWNGSERGEPSLVEGQKGMDSLRWSGDVDFGRRGLIS
jgi:hypothetical protein